MLISFALDRQVSTVFRCFTYFTISQLLEVIQLKRRTAHLGFGFSLCPSWFIMPFFSFSSTISLRCQDFLLSFVWPIYFSGFSCIWTWISLISIFWINNTGYLWVLFCVVWYLKWQYFLHFEEKKLILSGEKRTLQNLPTGHCWCAR